MKDNTWETERIAAQEGRIKDLTSSLNELKDREKYVGVALIASLLFTVTTIINQSAINQGHAQDKVYADLYRNYGRIPNK